MMVRNLTLAAAAAALAATPIAGHAAPPSQRTAAEMSGQKEELAGLVWQFLILPLIIAAVLALVAGGGSDGEPASP